MRIVVLGATGKTGRQLVEQALDRGHSVTALVHDGAVVPFAGHLALTVVRADVLDPATLEHAFEGRDGVVSALGSHRRIRRVHVYSEGIRNVIAGMREQGVRRLVCLSAAGVGDSYRELPPVFRFGIIPVYAAREYADMSRMEEEVAASGLEWTIVRPVWLRDTPAIGTVALARDGIPAGHPGISRADVAAFMLDALESGAWVGERVGLARPRS